MPFLNFQRAIYAKSQLTEVVCQLRFPRILMINEEQPAAFQERIRDDYPLFQVVVEQQQHITVDIGSKEIQPIPRLIQSETTNNYKFSSVDENWRVNLTSTFLALSTSRYDRWENFQEHLKKPL
ncbi:MAG: TIGR04255 family protein, partial [Gracilibacteraceae bacterium]|nr:TIGR04255 family protein [Gracilibacteraceae bacterium]